LLVGSFGGDAVVIVAAVVVVITVAAAVMVIVCQVNEYWKTESCIHKWKPVFMSF
jgi:hypothetical protein